MKTANIPLYVGIPLIGLGLMATFGDFFPKEDRSQEQESIPTVADEIVFSEDVNMLQEKFDTYSKERDEAHANVSAIESALVTAKNEEKAKSKVVCMTQYMLAEAKWSETPAYRTDDLDRYEMSMQIADQCIASFR